MKIAKIIIWVVPEEGEEKFLRLPLSRILTYENNKWRVLDDANMSSEEIELVQAMEDVKSKIGSI